MVRNLSGVQMPQNDRAQLDQIIREYKTEPAKGIAHGLQKDAIQNGIGASVSNSYNSWKMTFELTKIKMKDALIFWDEGTYGLTGDLLSTTEIGEKMSKEPLGPNERYSRFMSRFVSGENIGPGMFGRGKLIFSGASQSRRILIDSYRRSDGEYIATERWLDGVVLNQLDDPKIGDEAKLFIKERTGNVLKPLETYGTRITIFDVDKEVAKSFNDSFQSAKYKDSFAYAIEETWWELMLKHEITIMLKKGANTVQVTLSDYLKNLLNAIEGEDSFRVHEKQNISVIVSGQQYRIKNIKLIVSPIDVEDDFRDVWIQRKGMKIGSIKRSLSINSRISNRLCGFVTLEPDLEKVVEEAEGTTHYGFNLRLAGVRQIMEAVRSAIDELETLLGFSNVNRNLQSQKQLAEVLKELNDVAEELGLATQDSFGLDKSNIDIIVKELKLPEQDSLRVEFGDSIGPIKYEILNKGDTVYQGKVIIRIKQKGRDPYSIIEKDIVIDEGSSIILSIDSVTVDTNRFNYDKAIIEAAVFDSTSDNYVARSIRSIFIGVDPPVSYDQPVKLFLKCKFPRNNTRRLEISEVLSGIEIKIINNTPYDLKVGLKSLVRYFENITTGRPMIDLFSLLEKDSIELKANSELYYSIDDIVIKPDIFANVLNADLHINERTCELFAAVYLKEACIPLGLRSKQRLGRSIIKFYLEVDPPGYSIFTKLLTTDAPENPEQSWYLGDSFSGYTFYLNIGHPVFKQYQKINHEVLLKQYQIQQMMSQAYILAIANEVFKGRTADYKASITDPDSSPADVIKTFSKMLGMGLGKVVEV